MCVCGGGGGGGWRGVCVCSDYFLSGSFEYIRAYYIICVLVVVLYYFLILYRYALALGDLQHADKR